MTEEREAGPVAASGGFVPHRAPAYGVRDEPHVQPPSGRSSSSSSPTRLGSHGGNGGHGAQLTGCVSPREDAHYPSCALGLALTKSEPGATYIEYSEGDCGNPTNWTRGRKLRSILVTFLFAMTTAIAATSYNSTQQLVMDEFHVSSTVYLLGNTFYLSIGVAFTPLLLAPLSEIFGRLPIFLASALGFAIMWIPQALAPNIEAILISRLIQGCFASVGNSMTGGTVSDVYATDSRGFPMSAFCLLIYIGQSLGPVAAAYILKDHGSWRWVFGFQGILAAVTFVLMVIFLRETRGPVLLSRRARRLTKETGKLHRCSADDERTSFWTAVKISLSRPAVWLFTEPIVAAFSLWIGFLWGCVFLLLQSVPIVFEAYGWSNARKSLVLLSIGGGGILGWICNFHQEKLYARAVARAAPNKPAPEARLYWACVGAVMGPIGFFIYAWTGRAGISPVGPVIGLIIFLAATYAIYLAVFTYIADCYARYSSSGLAAQSWLRNVFAGTFVLFAPPMYHNLTPPIASTVLGAIAAVLGICPFLLMAYGAKIRSKSRVARALQREEEEIEEKMRLERERNARRAKRLEEKKGLHTSANASATGVKEAA